VAWRHPVCRCPSILVPFRLFRTNFDAVRPRHREARPASARTAAAAPTLFGDFGQLRSPIAPGYASLSLI